MLLIEEEVDENKEKTRFDLQRSMIDIFKNSRSIPLGIRNKAKI